MAEWYVGQGGQQKGPLSEADLKAMLARGEIAPADLVWKDGMAEWKAISTLPELRPAPAAPAAPPPPAPAPPPPAYAPPPAPAYAPAPPPAPAPVADTSSWSIGRGGQQLGPYSTADVQRMAASGQIAPGDVLWKEGMAQWLPIGSIPEFAARPGAPGMPGMQPYPGYASGPSPVGLFFSNFIKDTKGVIADPDKGLEEAADRKSFVFPLVWICLKVLLGGLMVFQLAGGRAPTSMGEAMQALAAMGNMAGGGGDSTFVVFIKSMLFDAIQIGVVFGALMLVLAGIFRTQEPLPKCMAIIGLSYIPVVAVAAVVFILGWLHPWFRCLTGAIEPARLILFYLIFQHTTQKPRRMAVLCVVAILFGCSIISGVIPRF